MSLYNKYFILKDREVIEVSDMEWTRWRMSCPPNRIIRKNFFSNRIAVQTSFTGQRLLNVSSMDERELAYIKTDFIDKQDIIMDVFVSTLDDNIGSYEHELYADNITDAVTNHNILLEEAKERLSY